jgi:hypothetical protein
MRPDKFTAVGLIARLALARISKSNSLVDGAPVRTYLFLIAVILNHVAAIAATTSYTCIFPVENSPKGLSRPATPFELRYLEDTTAMKSYLMGNNGSSEVHGIKNMSGTSFIEITGSGNVQVTAITNTGDAVHSRNSIISGNLIPSQYYGKCNVR